MGELKVWAAAWRLLPWLSSEELGKEHFEQESSVYPPVSPLIRNT